MKLNKLVGFGLGLLISCGAPEEGQKNQESIDDFIKKYKNIKDVTIIGARKIFESGDTTCYFGTSRMYIPTAGVRRPFTELKECPCEEISKIENFKEKGGIENIEVFDYFEGQEERKNKQLKPSVILPDEYEDEDIEPER